uniref:FZ domain-containing protein n=1 Tax=Ditylenchus dipsaci TaxID=166011 RepID=A0A915CXU4_9BILA
MRCSAAFLLVYSTTFCCLCSPGPFYPVPSSCQTSELCYKPCKQKVTADANIVKTTKADFKSTAALVLLLALCCTFSVLCLFSKYYDWTGYITGMCGVQSDTAKDYFKWLQVNVWVPECLRPTGANHSNSSSTSSTSCHEFSFPELNSPTAYGSGPPASSTNSTANSATCAFPIDTFECLLINDTLNHPLTYLSHLLLPGQQYQSQVDSFGMENNNEYPRSNGNIRFQPTSNHNYATSHRSQPPESTLTKSDRLVETPAQPPALQVLSQPAPLLPPPLPSPGHPDDLEDEGHLFASSSTSIFIGVQLTRPLLMPYPCPASPTPSSMSRAVVRMDFSSQQPLYSEEIQENGA